MKIIGWIRVGDKAACGATVAEGYENARYNGVPFTFHGARLDCPQGCVVAESNGHFKLPNGQFVPHHGHRTSGGCPLHSTANEIGGYSNSSVDPIPEQYIPDGAGGWKPCGHGSPYDLSFLVEDDRTKRPMGNLPYRIVLDSGRTFDGRTDDAGRTQVDHSDRQEHASLIVPFYGDISTATDASVEPDACDC